MAPPAHFVRPLFAAAAAVALLATALGVVAAPVADAAPRGTNGADFDGDGFDDLVVSAPGEDIGSAAATGAVTVLYGRSAGLSGAASQNIHQGTPGVPGSNEPVDQWGLTTAHGDLDGDGFDDLVVGAPTETIGTGQQAATFAGAITVLYGSADGLVTAGATSFHQGSPSVPGALTSRTFFGSNLAVADFDGDGHDDVAVSAPGDAVGDVASAGTVTVLYGSANGLSSAGSVRLHQGSPGVPGVNEEFDQWGSELAAGDFDGDDRDDLAVGTPFEALGDDNNAGTVTVLRGAAGGLSGTDAVFLHQDVPGVPGKAEAGDVFGFSLATGDTDGDGLDDLAVGAPLESIGTSAGAGSVTVFLGSDDGLVGEFSSAFNQDSSGVPGINESDDNWGAALALSDMNGDDRADLAVGAHLETVGQTEETGAVTVLYGGSGGITGSGAASFHQNRSGVPGGNEADDNWGITLSAGDFDGDGTGDLAVGAVEAIGSVANTGAVTLLYGTGSGLGPTDSRLLHQGSAGIVGVNEANDGWYPRPGGVPIDSVL